MRIAVMVLLAAVACAEERSIDKDTEVAEDIVVAKGDKLVIQPGVTLKFAPDAGIVCRGVIEAKGTQVRPIKFVPRDSGKGWRNIALLAPGSDGSAFSFCRFTGGHGRPVRFTLDPHFKH